MDFRSGARTSPRTAAAGARGSESVLMNGTILFQRESENERGRIHPDRMETDQGQLVLYYADDLAPCPFGVLAEQP
jgi:hypothetical protein